MAGLNNVQLIGYLGRDPELRFTQQQRPVAMLNIATTRKYKDRADKLCEETEWHRVVVWGPAGENASKYLRKGSMVFVSGRLKTTKWQDKDGADRWSTDVVAESVQFLDRRPGDGRPHPADTGSEGDEQRTSRGFDDGSRTPPPSDTYVPSDPGDDDIPF